MQTYVHAVSERGETLLRCAKCDKSEPLDRQAWQDCLNTFVAQHYHVDEPSDG
ncbi:MAG: hypothetical protein ACYC2H_02740 [Thermoplasmatota archaeon]